MKIAELIFPEPERFDYRNSCCVNESDRAGGTNLIGWGVLSQAVAWIFLGSLLVATTLAEPLIGSRYRSCSTGK